MCSLQRRLKEWAGSHGREVRSATIRTLIDTGAFVGSTGTDASILRKMDLPPVGAASLATPSGSAETDVYMVRFIIPSRKSEGFFPSLPRIVVDNVRVVAVKIENQPYRGLLGRDVLSGMVMVYNGPHALITLGY